MSTLKQRILRRVRNQELAQRDAANRCATCKRALPKYGISLDLVTGKKYCSLDCALDDEGVSD